jgi:predicted phage terminase large subunit-like protein
MKPDEIRELVKTDSRAILRAACKASLFHFIKIFWSEFDASELQVNWHMEKICEEMELVGKRVAAKKKADYDLLVNVPPGTSKSAMVSVFFPVWCWINWYWMRFITSSHGWDLSLELARKSRDIIQSEKFQRIFPDIGIRQDRNKESNFVIIKREYVGQGIAPIIHMGGGRRSTSVTSKVTGFHAHIIIWDDLVDQHAAISEADMKTAIRHLDQGLSTRKVDKKVTTMIGIMQRLSQADPSGHWLKKRPDEIKHICLPGEIKDYKQFLKPAEWAKYYKDDLLDPVRMGWEELEKMRSILGQYGYAGQIGQNPVPPGGGMFQIENISITDKLPHVDQYVSTVRYWDKAGTEGGGAYTVGVKMTRLNNDKFMILDVKRGQWASHEREQIIRQCAEADGKSCKIYIEQEPGSGGKESVQNSIRNLAGYSAYADRPTGDKALRADPLSVQVNNGNVILYQARWNEIYLEELENFPFSLYKDQVDATSGAFNAITHRKKAGVMRRS